MRAKRSLFATLLAFAITGCTATPVRTAQRSVAAPPVRIVVLGDSLGLGTGASGPADGFAFDLYRRLARERPGSSIRDYAIGGARIADVLRLEVPRLRGERFDLIIIVAGGNDVVRGTAPGAFARTYARTLDAVAAAQPRASVVACGVPDVAISPIFAGSDVAAIAKLSSRDDRAVRVAAAARTIPIVDLFSISRAAEGEIDTFLSADRFHPSDVGYRRMADAAYPAIVRALLRRTNSS